MHRPSIVCCIALLMASCGGIDERGSRVSGNDSGLGPPDARADTTAADVTRVTDADLHPTCVISATSTLPHVHIDFTSTQCVFTLSEARAGIAIAYKVVIDQDVPGFVPSPFLYGPDFPGLDLNEVVEGNNQSYCLCDQGLPYWVCPLEDGGTSSSMGSECPPYRLLKGEYYRTFYWDGVNWYGPSDTGNPRGAPFPAGDYTFTVSTAPGKITSVDGGADASTNTAASAQAKFLVRLIP